MTSEETLDGDEAGEATAVADIVHTIVDVTVIRTKYIKQHALICELNTL